MGCSEISHSHLVRLIGNELVPHHTVLVDDREKIVVRCGAGGAGLAALLVMTGGDPGNTAQPVKAVLPDGDAVLVGKFVGEEPVAQSRVVAIELVEDVDESARRPSRAGSPGL